MCFTPKAVINPSLGVAGRAYKPGVVRCSIQKSIALDIIQNRKRYNTSQAITMTLKELEQHLLTLSPSEKLQAIQLLSQSLSNTWQGVEKSPGVCGGDARITNTRIPIWVLVEARRFGYSDIDLLTSYPTLSATDLANAWAYAQAYPDEIELAIQRNEAA